MVSATMMAHIHIIIVLASTFGALVTLSQATTNLVVVFGCCLLLG